jgi:hypothetical protein
MREGDAMRRLALLILGANFALNGCMTVNVTNHAERDSRIVCTVSTAKPVTVTPRLSTTGEDIGEIFASAAGLSDAEQILKAIAALRKRLEALQGSGTPGPGQ